VRITPQHFLTHPPLLQKNVDVLEPRDKAIPCHNRGIDTVTVKPKIGIILGTLHHAGQQDL
jgi:hypothetical protein